METCMCSLRIHEILFEKIVICKLYRKNKIPAQQQKKIGPFENTYLSFSYTTCESKMSRKFAHT